MASGLKKSKDEIIDVSEEVLVEVAKAKEVKDVYVKPELKQKDVVDHDPGNKNRDFRH
jgi:hypothetical protein